MKKLMSVFVCFSFLLGCGQKSSNSNLYDNSHVSDETDLVSDDSIFMYLGIFPEDVRNLMDQNVKDQCSKRYSYTVVNEFMVRDTDEQGDDADYYVATLSLGVDWAFDLPEVVVKRNYKGMLTIDSITCPLR